jgi:hypothetical protein
MTVNEWFNNGCDYKEGVALYEALENHNKNFLKIFKKRNSPQNRMKLKYELQKKLTPTNIAAVQNSLISEKYKRNIQININVTPKPVAENKYFRKLLISQLPIELHPFYIQQKTDYNTYCSLKMQLNELTNVRDTFGNLVLDEEGKPKFKAQTPLDIEKARVICLKIETLFDAIDKTWQIIDHFLETKEVMIIQQKSFEDLSPGKIRDKIVSVRGSRTRQNQRLKLLKNKLNNAIAKKYKIKYSRDLTKCKAKLMQLDQDLIQLIQIRDNEK